MKYIITAVLLLTALFGVQMKEFVMEKLENSQEKKEVKRMMNEKLAEAFLKMNGVDKDKNKEFYNKLVTSLNKEC